MDKEQQLAEARKILKKYRARNSAKNSSRKSAQEKKFSIATTTLKDSSPAGLGQVPLLTNGVPQLGQATAEGGVANQAEATELQQPLNSTPNQNFALSGSSRLRNMDGLSSSNLPTSNGSMTLYPTPSPIFKPRQSGVASVENIPTPSSKESSPMSLSSLHEGFSKNGLRLEVAENGLGSYQSSSEPVGNYLRQNDLHLGENLGRAGSEAVFSGVSQGGMLVNHLAYLPATRAGGGVPVMGYSREGGGGVVRHGEEGRGKDLFGGVAGSHERLIGGGRYAAEEDIVELEQKVKIHAQTIDILVSEKSSLQSELSDYKSQLASKSRECLDADIKLKSTERKVSKLEIEAAAMSSDLSKSFRELEAAKREKAELQRSLERLQASLEDQREEGTELISKVTTQSAEMVRLQEFNASLQGKLSMAELLLSQQQSGDKSVAMTPMVDPSLSLRLQESESRVEQLQRDLNHVVGQRDQANLDLASLQQALAAQREENSKKLLENEKDLSEYRDQATQLKKEVDELFIDKQVLEKKLSTEHAQMEHSFQVAMETVQEERDQLAKQLESKIQESNKLVKKNTEVENRSFEQTIKVARLEEQSVDHGNLMRTMTQDKEALSRAMAQNKELKANTVELQEAFVRISNQNMELATELDTERQRLAQLKLLQATPTAAAVTPTGEQLLTSVASVGEATPAMSLVTASADVGSSSSVEVAENGVQTDWSADDGGLIPGRGMVHPGGVAGSPEDLSSSTPSVSEVLQYSQALEQERSRLLRQIESLNEEKAQLQDQLNLSQSLLAQTPPRTTGEGPDQILKPTSESVDEFAPMVTNEQSVEEMASEPSENPAAAGSSMSPVQLAQLQASFEALQVKFVSLMRERADLLDLLEEHKLLLVTSAQRVEAMDDRTVVMYQKECESLRQQFLQKDVFIEKLRTDKATMQRNIYQLQVLMRRMISEQKSRPHPVIVTPTSADNFRQKAGGSGIGPSHSSPAVSHQTSLPIHLRPQWSNESVSSNAGLEESLLLHPNPSSGQGSLVEASAVTGDTEDGGNFSHLTDDSSYTVTNETAEQIIELLDRLEKSGNVQNGTMELMHCKTCTGQLQSL